MTTGYAKFDAEPGAFGIEVGHAEGRVVVTIEADGLGLQLQLPPRQAAKLAAHLIDLVETVQADASPTMGHA